MFISISIGASSISLQSVLDALFSPNGDKESMIIRELRLPRAVIGIFIGANLAVAGAIMQAITRNPLASPQIFGINAGASLVVVASLVFLPNLPYSSVIYLAFLGAALGGSVVYYLSSTDGAMTVVKLALAGMAVHLFLTAITESLIIFHEHTTQNILFWLAGAIDGLVWKDVVTVLPWATIGLISAILLARPLTIMGLGEDVSKGLGQNNNRIRFLSGIIVVLLAGSSVSVAGPIGFVGLIIPHIVRKFVGVDYLLVIPCSAMLGAILLLYSDIVSRFIAFPFESPVGIVTALIGAPFFLYLARRGGN